MVNNQTTLFEQRVGNRQMILDIMAIPLTQGLYALVDGRDCDWLNQWKWCVLKGKHTTYAFRSQKRKTIYMHREIMHVSSGFDIDHRNHNGLDNREKNLRICSRTENLQHQQIPRGQSKYKGVHYNKEMDKWRAIISHNGKTIHLGYFNSEIEAARAYDRKAKKLFSEFAYLNFRE